MVLQDYFAEENQSALCIMLTKQFVQLKETRERLGGGIAMIKCHFIKIHIALQWFRLMEFKNS
jgi:hypothetical protein